MNDNTLTVAKFGGTSLQNLQAMRQCAQIIADDPSIRVVVVSAPAGITDLLIRMTEAAISNEPSPHLYTQLQTNILSIVEEITTGENLTNDIETLLADLKLLTHMLSKAYSAQLADELLSFGERFSSRLMYEVLQAIDLPAKQIDARSILQTDSSYGCARPNIQQIAQNAATIMRPLIDDHIIITEGFIGACNNITTTLGRGGSDYSAALFSEALAANSLQIWTDVAGLYDADPRLVSSASIVHRISFHEAAELATFGAKVLHPSSLWPAIRANINVYVGSSFSPEIPGTWIMKNLDESMPIIRSISLRRQQCLLTIESIDMFHAEGFLAKVFAILAKYHLSVDLITTSEVSVALTLDNMKYLAAKDQNLLNSVLTEVESIGEVSVTMENDLSLIAIIGNQLTTTPGISRSIFSALEPYNVRLICHGASEHNICVLVNSAHDKAIVSTLHDRLFMPNEEKI